MEEMTEEEARLDELPHELICRILVAIDSVMDLAHVACCARAFRSLHVIAALRLRASESFVTADDDFQLLCWRERRLIPPCSVAAGQNHSTMVDVLTGKLLACGHDDRGLGFLGLGDVTSSPFPTHVAITERVISVAAHSQHTLALGESATVYTFGYGNCGKLGHGDEHMRWRPEAINLQGQCAVGVSAGQQHSLVLTRGGVALAFGSGFSGKLGLGDQANRLLPCRIHWPSRSEGEGEDEGEGAGAGAGEGAGEGEREGTAVRALAAGTVHSLAATRDGALYAWGCAWPPTDRSMHAPPPLATASIHTMHSTGTFTVCHSHTADRHRL